MKKAVIFIIAIVVIAVLILIGSLGMEIMDEAFNISENNTISFKSVNKEKSKYFQESNVYNKKYKF